jgi:RHS repeat-associated protein
MKKVLFIILAVTLKLSAQNVELVTDFTTSTYSTSKSYLFTGSVKLQAPASGSLIISGATHGNVFIRPASGATIPKNIPPNPEQNFVRIENIHVGGVTNEDQINYLQNGDKLVQYQYSDNIGRLSQSVNQAISPSANDLVKFYNYSSLDGRIYDDYLPYVPLEKNGAIKTNPASGVESFYSNGANGIPNDSRPNTTLDYEKSVLNRIKVGYGAGVLWYHKRSGTFRGVSSSHELNEANTIRRWYLDVVTDPRVTPKPKSDGTYPENTLAIEVTTDEHGYTTKTYTDYRGNVVCINHNFLLTYYVYDSFGLLRYVLPPEISKVYTGTSTASTTLEELNRWGFQYKYDSKKRLIKKKGPGPNNDWVEYVYDQWDRLVATQDGVQRLKNPQEWSFIKYDIINRPIITGVLTRSSTTDLEVIGTRYEDENSSDIGYTTTQSFPYTGASSINSITINAIMYYDDYSFIANAVGWAANNAIYNADGGLAVLNTVNGNVTGSKTRLLNGSGWLNSVVYYDNEYRPVHSIERNHLSTTPDRITNAYDFAGQLLQSQRKHYNPNTSAIVTITENFEYDHAGRLKKNYHQIDNNPKVLVGAYNYNELGQLIESNLHSTDGGNSFLQSVDYRYNIRGWLTSINNSTLSNDGGATNNDTGDLFGLNLTYNQDAPDFNGAPQLYDGRITAARWSSKHPQLGAKERIYGYAYDGHQRFSQAKYATMDNNGAWAGDLDLYNLAVTYNDDHGNINTVQRYSRVEGAKTLIDNLDYDYATNGNELTTVDDLTNNHFGYPDKTDGIAVEMDYDKNGNVKSDLNSEITTVTYNVLNLPESILIDLPSPELDKTILYEYDASGYVTRKIYKKGTTTVRTVDYVKGIQYYDQNLAIVFTSEGRATAYNGSYEYEYFLKDHLTNTRVAFGYLHGTDLFTATMEDDVDVSAREISHFRNVAQSRNVGYNHTKPSQESTTPDRAARLSGYGTSPIAVGPAKMLQVKNGDKVSLEVFARLSGITSNTNLALNFASLVSTAMGGPGVIGEQAAQALNQNIPLLSINRNTNAPKAYLFYAIFNSSYTGVTQWGAHAVVGNTAEQRLAIDLTVPADGFLYTYVANETADPAVFAYFDDFKIIHQKVAPELRVTEVTDYDPFGLPLAGTNYIDETRIDNNYKYQGDFAEYESWTGWERFAGRGNYDTRLGRWHSIDPANQFVQLSPYSAMANNPVLYTDPTGEAVPLLLVAGAALIGGVGNVANNWDDISDPMQFMQYFAVGAASGGISFVNPLIGATVLSGGNLVIDVMNGRPPDMTQGITDFAFSFVGGKATKKAWEGAEQLAQRRALLDDIIRNTSVTGKETVILKNGVDALETTSKNWSGKVAKGTLKGGESIFERIELKELVIEQRSSVKQFLKFTKDEAIGHFNQHAKEIMKATKKSSYNLKDYIDDANWIIDNGTYDSNLRGYYQYIGNSSRTGESLFGFVGLKNNGLSISTYHIKTASQLGIR